MGTVYRVVITDGTAPGPNDSLPPAPIRIPEDADGPIVQGEYPALLVGTEVVPLNRRVGASILAASFKGTYVRVTTRVCMKCGAVVTAPQIGFGAPGCLPSLVAGIAATAYVASGDRSDLFDASMAGMGALCGSLLFTTFLGWSYAKLRWRDRQRSIARSACPSCDGKILRSITSLEGQTVALESQTRLVTVTRAGKS